MTFAEHRGFGSAHLCFTTCFPLGWMHALVCSPQPHDASINTQHNDYFILHFTPNFFLIFLLPLFHFSFWRLQLFPHIGPAMSHCLSLFSLHNFMANFRLFSEVSSQPQLLFFFFSSFIPTSPLLSVSASLGRIVTPFPFKMIKPPTFQPAFLPEPQPQQFLQMLQVSTLKCWYYLTEEKRRHVWARLMCKHLPTFGWHISPLGWCKRKTLSLLFSDS